MSNDEIKETTQNPVAQPESKPTIDFQREIDKLNEKIKQLDNKIAKHNLKDNELSNEIDDIDLTNII